MISVLYLLDVQILKQFDFTNTSHTKQGYEFMQANAIKRRLRLFVPTMIAGMENDTGLAGEQIPLASRNISLADRVDISLKQYKYSVTKRSSADPEFNSIAAKYLIQL